MRSLTEEKEWTCSVQTAAEREREGGRCGVKEGAAKAGRDIPHHPSPLLQPDTFAHLFLQVLYLS